MRIKNASTPVLDQQKMKRKNKWKRN